MRRLLLIDDNPGDVELITSCIEELDLGITVRSCQDGDEALGLLVAAGTREEFELVFLDWNVPKRHGREVLQALRADSGQRTTPVVVLTSSEAGPDIADAYDLGASSYLVKPVDFKQLQRKLAAVAAYWFEAVRLPPKRQRQP